MPDSQDLSLHEMATHPGTASFYGDTPPYNNTEAGESIEHARQGPVQPTQGTAHNDSVMAGRAPAAQEHAHLINGADNNLGAAGNFHSDQTARTPRAAAQEARKAIRKNIQVEGDLSFLEMQEQEGSFEENLEVSGCRRSGIVPTSTGSLPQQHVIERPIKGSKTTLANCQTPAVLRNFQKNSGLGIPVEFILDTDYDGFRLFRKGEKFKGELALGRTWFKWKDMTTEMKLDVGDCITLLKVCKDATPIAVYISVTKSSLADENGVHAEEGPSGSRPAKKRSVANPSRPTPVVPNGQGNIVSEAANEGEHVRSTRQRVESHVPAQGPSPASVPPAPAPAPAPAGPGVVAPEPQLVPRTLGRLRDILARRNVPAILRVVLRNLFWKLDDNEAAEILVDFSYADEHGEDDSAVQELAQNIVTRYRSILN